MQRRDDTSGVTPPSPGLPPETVRLPPDTADVASPVATDTPSAPSAHDTADLYRDYAIVRKIGDGGMGIVYLARDRRLGRPVAIKRLRPSALASPALRGRFLHEARAAGALSHPGIVHVYTLGEDAEGPYIVMEYVAGEQPDPATPDAVPPPRTLEQHVRQRGPLPTSEAVALLLKICRAVAYAHSRGVIHRDLKPANILMDPYGDPKVGDFGLARPPAAEDSHLTAPGEKLLSLGYGAPEQETDAAACDERADVYGLGALFFFLITGQNPRYFREEDLPPPVREPLCRAMARDRDQRPASVHEFADDIAALAGPAAPEAPTVKRTWRCKWCDTVNPVTIRFCAECGWDGGEPCRECGADMFVGMPFCRRCGASARDYEQVERALVAAQRLFSRRDFEGVLARARLLPKFEPAGPGGRAMLERLGSLRAQAEKNLERRHQLPELVAMEMRVENFERAEAFIREFRSLSPDGSTDFATELASIPDAILHRDLTRVERMFRTGDWEPGHRLLTKTLARPGTAGDPLAERLRRRYRWHRQRRALRATVAAAASLAALYLLAAAPLASAAAEFPWLHALFAPARRLYAAAPGLSRRYASLWTPHAVANQPSAWFGDEPGASPAPPEMRRILDGLERRRLDADAAYNAAMDAWRHEYQVALRDLHERCRAEGDFEGLRAVLAETARFERAGDLVEISPAVGDDDALPRLQASFLERRVAERAERDTAVAEAGTAAVAALKTLRSDLTKSDRMAAAALVDEEIRRLAPTAR